MKCVLFCHAFTSCWNNGNAHFLRGVARALVDLGHEVVVHEPEDGWSRVNALRDGGAAWLAEAERLVPGVSIRRYRLAELDLAEAVDGADLVLAHEWNEPALIARLSRLRAAGGTFTLMFHDTHHRAVTAPEQMEAFELDGFDGVLAFGGALREVYLRHGWGRRVFTWHEAADTALFRPLPAAAKDCDLVWIGNWGDEERSAELREFLIEPAAQLGLRARIHGVRYPQSALDLLHRRGIEFAGWLPNHHVPRAFARARATVHVPRAPYARALPGIPTIRVFEALACGLPLVSAPWRDVEGLFPPGAYLHAADGEAMTAALRRVLADDDLAGELAANGPRIIAERHTCRHRARELLAIVASLTQTPRHATASTTSLEAAAP
jgi:spore maturation protein CgeB